MLIEPVSSPSGEFRRRTFLKARLWRNPPATFAFGEDLTDCTCERGSGGSRDLLSFRCRSCVPRPRMRGDAEHLVKKAGKHVSRKIRQGPDLVSYADTENRPAHDVFHPLPSVDPGCSQPRFGHRTRQHRITAYARALGNLHQSVFGQFRQKLPPLGMVRAAVEHAATHPQSLERVPDSPGVSLHGRAEAPVNDVGRNNRRNEAPDIIPQGLAGCKIFVLCQPGSGFCVKNRKGISVPATSESMRKGQLFKCGAKLLQLSAPDSGPAGGRKPNRLGKVFRIESLPLVRSALQEISHQHFASRAGKSGKEVGHPCSPNSASARKADRKTPGRFSRTDRMKAMSFPGHALRSHVEA